VSIQDRIRKVRNELGLSQEKFGQKIGRGERRHQQFRAWESRAKATPIKTHV